MLPHVLAFNAPSAKEATTRIATALGTDDAISGLNTLWEYLQAPTSLKDLGLAQENIPEAVQLILPAIPDSNPRTVTAENLTTLLTAAFTGTEPSNYTAHP
jgi:maleylacetate reductase